MIDFFKEYWQWIVGAVLVPVIGFVLRKTGRKQKVGEIHGDGNTVINGDVKDGK